MLKLTQLTGFNAGGSADVTPNAINFNDISDAGVTAAAATNVVTITGIDTPITLRLSLTSAMLATRTVDVYRDATFVTQGASGLSVDVVMQNNQTLQYIFSNTLDNTTWTGTATVTNVTDNNAILDTFLYTLQDTGTGGVGVGGVGVGGVGVGGPLP